MLPKLAYFFLPDVESRLADAHLPADICHRSAAIDLPQRIGDLQQSVRVVFETALAHDPGLEVGPSGPFGQLAADLASGQPFSQLLQVSVSLATPLVAIGAPAAAYYGEVARRLGAMLQVPPHAQVCNAVGAAAGVVSEVCELTVNQPVFNVFRIHDPAGSRDFSDADAAIEEAKRLARTSVLAAALRSGASDPHVEITVKERRAKTTNGGEYLAEATACARATGMPAMQLAAADSVP